MNTIPDACDDPIEFGRQFWPDVTFYREQKEIICSVRDNDETFVPAGNMLGKDFVAAFIVLWYFLTRHPCKIVTTSVKEDHLNVLWGEIDKFVRLSRYPLEASRRGPLIINDRGIKKVVDGRVHKDAYVMKQVANEKSMECFQGHHVTPDPGQPPDCLPRNLFVGDEASGLHDTYYRMASTWAKRMLLFGNTWECNNFFKRAIKGDPSTKDPGGDLKAPDNGRYHRKVIKIRGADSPNVRHALAAIKKYKGGGMDRRDMLKAVATVLVPGVLTYQDYQKRRATWDKIRQCVSLDAEFYEGAEVLMFPSPWLNRAETIAADLGGKQRKADAIGVDSAQGGDNTAWVAVDKLGLIDMLSKKTPDTSVIPGDTIEFMRKHGIGPQQADKVTFDLGGGGKEHVDRLRNKLGYKVRGVAFSGAASTADKFKRYRTRKERGESDEIRLVYKNRRAEMYGILMGLLDPANKQGFGLPTELINTKRSDGGASLREQLAPIPKDYGNEGVLELRPKNKRNAEDTRPTLVELIGCSPDEADALVLATFGLVRKATWGMIRAY